MAGQGKRGGGTKKTSSKPATDADDSYIVFSNSKDNPKTKKSDTKALTSKNGVNTTQPIAEDASKKPSIKQLIGGPSWTGPLPLDILHKHCIREKWQKPQYTWVSFIHQTCCGWYSRLRVEPNS